MENKYDILLVDSKKCDREVLPTLLKWLGFTTYVANEIEDVYVILENKEGFTFSSVIISDETLDRKQLDLIKWIKQNHQELKLIAISCRYSDEDSCKDLDVFFLQKPITDCKVIASLLRGSGHKKETGAK